MTRRGSLLRIAILLAVALAFLLTPIAAVARGPRPANDDVAAAVDISFPMSSTVDVSRITRAVEDPGPFCFNGGTVWYRLSSADRRMVTFSSIGSEVPAGIEVYRVVDGALQLHGCAYDFMTTPAALQVEPNATYYFMAGPTTAGSVRGAITVTIDTLGIPPAHDAKAGAIDIGLGTLTSDSTGGTSDADDFFPCFAGGATMWHRYLPAANGRVGATIHADAYPPILNVGLETDSGIQSLGCISANDVPVFVDVTGGQTYWFLVGNPTGQLGGPYRLSLFDAPRLSAVLTVESGTVDRATGSAVIRGTVRCSADASYSPGVVVKQRGRTGFGSGPTVACGDVPVGWETTVQPDSGSFGNGPADVEAGGPVFTQFDSSNVSFTTSLILRGG